MIYGPSKGADLIEQSTYIYTPDMDTPPPNLLTFFSFAQALSKALKKRTKTRV